MVKRDGRLLKIARQSRTYWWGSGAAGKPNENDENYREEAQVGEPSIAIASPQAGHATSCLRTLQTSPKGGKRTLTEGFLPGSVLKADMGRSMRLGTRMVATALASASCGLRPTIAGEELKLLNRAQRAWVNYRTLSCEAEYAMYGGGTGGPVTRLACREALTRDRIAQLHDAYDWRVEKYRWTSDHPSVR